MAGRNESPADQIKRLEVELAAAQAHVTTLAKKVDAAERLLATAVAKDGLLWVAKTGDEYAIASYGMGKKRIPIPDEMLGLWLYGLHEVSHRD